MEMIMKISTDNILAAKKHYAPFVLGNGDLSFQVDYEGVQVQKEHCKMIPAIWRAGHRWNTPKGELISFGYFTQRMNGLGELDSWEQSINLENGLLSSICKYKDGTVIESGIFCHLECNLIVIEKKITTTLSEPFYFEYHFGSRHIFQSNNGQGLINYDIDGLDRYTGTIEISSDVPVSFRHSENLCTMETASRTFRIFIAFDGAASEVQTLSFASLLESSAALWAEFWNESYANIPSEKIRKVYEVSKYHLRISSSRWSVPTGIFGSHWNAQYFAFDEYFIMMGLLTSGFMKEAYKIPHFRYQVLHEAKLRSALSGMGRTKDNGTALYPWQTNEHGLENTIPGFWQDHIFHESNIALTAWEYFRFSGDMDLLKQELYPVIRACVEWIRQFKIQKDGDKVFIGPCTDLERLGTVKTNAFMTTCSVVAAMNAAVSAAKRLKIDDELISIWGITASALKANLPTDGFRYIPYPGCMERSIGVLSGIFPYPILDKDDLFQARAVTDYIENEGACGNMYAQGKGVCTWYACWRAIVAVRMGNYDEALTILEKTAEETGCFSEIFEIYECGIRPWFTTAEGSFIQAVNEILLCSVAKESASCSNMPELWRNIPFRLQGLNGTKIISESVSI